MKKIINIFGILILSATFANAKWWIFGKSKDDITIKYLTINSVSADESAGKITLFKEMLQDGKILIKGKASGVGQIGYVKISIDGKNTWQDAKFSEDGAFEYSFNAEQGKKYNLYIEITNTAGKTNKVDETAKEIIISNERINEKVKETLDSIFDAYNNENTAKFMSYVSDNFAGDRDFLELAIKKDFNALSDIKLRYSINNIASGSGKVFVSLTYNRMVFVNKTGTSNTDNGITEMVFEMKDDKLKLYSMKKPLLFGLSDADNVATGQTPGQSEGIVIDNGDLSGAIETVSISCSGVDPYLHPLYYFSTGETGCHYINDMNEKGQIGEFIIYGPLQAELQHNGQMKEFNKSISSLTEAEVKNLAGYTQPVHFNINATSSYGIYIDGKFYAVQFVITPAASGVQNTSFKVRKF